MFVPSYHFILKFRISVVFYLLAIVSIVGSIFLILNFGKDFKSNIISTSAVVGAEKHVSASLSHAFLSPLLIFILQLAVIILVCQVFVFLVRKVGQPAVIGEMITGIVLGPSLVGTLLPEVNTFIFPEASLVNLQMVSQVGLVFFMFVIGMEINLQALRRKARVAVIISHASILVPYLLGVILSLFLYRLYAPANIPFYAFALFTGIAMSITAFPVLARIIKERRIVHTRVGTIAITCAAADDITAWCLLAFVIAIVKADSLMASVYTVLLTALYIIVMIYGIKPLVRKVVERRNTAEKVDRNSVALVFVILLLSAFVSELIGIHSLFGAFLAGIIMPQGFNFREQIITRIEDFATVLLLPLFFVFTGLRTEVGLLNNGNSWMICLLITVIAIAGKFGGSALAAKINGETNYNSLVIGSLMNTRGLIELVVLNIGYDLGVLGPELFAMLVIMA
ncbi:MAG: cation/H(+) antiporter, partial [Pedobacter sp.]